MDAEGTFTVCRLNLGHGCISQHKVAQAPLFLGVPDIRDIDAVDDISEIVNSI